MDSYLLENDIINNVYDDVSYRIIHKDINNKIIFLIELDTIKTHFISFNFTELEEKLNAGDYCLESPSHDIFASHSITKKQKVNMESRYKILENILEISPIPLIFQNKYKSRAVKLVTERFQINPTLAYKIIRLYFQGGKTKISLLPTWNKCGGKGKKRYSTKKVGRKNNRFENNISPMLGEKANGVVISEELHKNIVTTVKRTLLSKKKYTYKQAYNMLLYDFFSPVNKDTGQKEILPDFKIPTYNQFYYAVKQMEKHNSIKFLEARDSQRKFDLNFRPVLGCSSLEAIQPGYRYEIDATKPFIPLLDSTRTFAIGTATVYYVIDAFSIMIVGFYIGLDNPSKKTACSALLSCIEDKKETAKKYGIETDEDDFFVNLLPKNLTSDRGEIVGELGDRVVAQLGVNVETTASYRGDMKGIVEKAFDVTEKDLLGTIPNYTIKDWKKITRGDIRNDQYPVLTINDLRKVFLRHIKKHNKSAMKSYPMTKEMIADKLNPSPNEIWKWGVKNRGCDGIRPDLDFTRYILTEEKNGSITPRGVCYKDIYYTSANNDENILGWYSNARANGRSKIKIHMDERDISRILVLEESTKEIMTFIHTSRSQQQYGDISLHEYELYQHRKKNTSTLNLDNNNQNQIDYMDESNKDFKEITNKMRLGKPVKSNKREHRAEENAKDRSCQSVIPDYSIEEKKITNLDEKAMDIKQIRKHVFESKLANYKKNKE